MEFEIYNDIKEDKVKLRLIMSKEGCPTIIAVDEKGYKLSNGNILKFTKEGKICLYDCFDDSLGFIQDKNGYIEVEKY